MDIELFIKTVSTEKKRLLLRYIQSGGEKGVNIRKFPGPFAYNNLYLFTKEWLRDGVVEEAGKTERGKTFPNQAVLYRLSNEGKRIIKTLDYLEGL